MKLSAPTAFVLAVLVSLPLAAQTPTPAPPPASPPALSPEYSTAYQAALVDYQKKDYAAALSHADAAIKADPSNPAAWNLRGAIYTMQKNWGKAAEMFHKALELDPKTLDPRFNLIELDFLQKKYPEARKKFEVLAVENPKNEFLRYKILLCWLMEGNKSEAEKILQSFDFLGNTPAYYFANAAWHFSQNEREKARSYIISSEKIFSPDQNYFFGQSLFDLGWLEEPRK
jgi:Tfp pilus assembly protein PilF